MIHAIIDLEFLCEQGEPGPRGGKGALYWNHQHLELVSWSITECRYHTEYARFSVFSEKAKCTSDVKRNFLSLHEYLTLLATALPIALELPKICLWGANLRHCEVPVYANLCEKYGVKPVQFEKVVDIMHDRPWNAYTSPFSEKSSKSVDTMARNLGFKFSTDLDGSKVAEAFKRKEFEKIGKYNCDDNEVTLLVMNRVAAVVREKWLEFEG